MRWKLALAREEATNLLARLGGFGYGKRQGQGTFAYQDGGKYEGEWMGGKRDGQGKMIYPDGSVYEGMWKDNQKDGHGVLKWIDGRVYEGDFK